jgi:hypothetical protein
MNATPDTLPVIDDEPVVLADLIPLGAHVQRPMHVRRLHRI